MKVKSKTMASKKTATKTVIDEKAVKQTIKAYTAEINRLRKEQTAMYKVCDALGTKIYDLEDAVGDLNQILKFKTALTLVAGL
jgi:hypothetical protein